MTAKIINGIAIAKSVRVEVSSRVNELSRQGIVPGLAVVLVGENPASAVYVKNKIKACADVGIRSEVRHLLTSVSEVELLEVIETLNKDPEVHGVLVQLPLPPQISVRRVLEAVDVAKDIDGFHLYNVGGLVVGDTIFPPCTPYGV